MEDEDKKEIYRRYKDNADELIKTIEQIEQKLNMSSPKSKSHKQKEVCSSNHKPIRKFIYVTTRPYNIIWYCIFFMIRGFVYFTFYFIDWKLVIGLMVIEILKFFEGIVYNRTIKKGFKQWEKNK